jgi:N-acetylmuramoyl-L-alanine amidase
MYHLASGGWVFQRSVEPLTAAISYENEISDITLETGEDWEVITFHGTATPPYSAAVADGKLWLDFYHTTNWPFPDLSDSELITEVAVSESESDPGFAFTLDMDKYWGYLVQYDGTNTILTLKKRPELGSAEFLLEGVTVALDPGHGGTDNGAAGVALNDGAMEKEINLAAATATRRYLEGLGATVIMTREGDEKLELDEILAFNEAEKPDFFLSLHSNSLSYTSDGTEPSGVEVFYYEESDEALASVLAGRITEYTARVNREAKNDYYKVTLNSLGRSILIEMGFLTNPEEYDSLRSLDSIYATAVAIGDSLVEYLTEPEVVEVEVEVEETEEE